MLSHSISPEVYVIVLVIGAFLFWPMWWLASKFFKRTRNKVLASVLGSLVVAPFLYVGLIMGLLFSMHDYPSKTFTTDAWHAASKAPGDEVFTTRYEYSKDLIDRRLLIGKTRLEVIEILGHGYESPDRLSYDLGFVPGHGIDPDILEVYFENGVVVKVEQRRS